MRLHIQEHGLDTRAVLASPKNQNAPGNIHTVSAVLICKDVAGTSKRSVNARKGINSSHLTASTADVHYYEQVA